MMVFKRRKQAFMLVEILAVLFLGGLLVSLFAPMIGRRRPQETWEIVLESLNQVATLARQEALVRRKTVRVVFQHVRQGQDSFFVEEEGSDPEFPDDPFKKKYKMLDAAYVKMPVLLPPSKQIRAVFSGKNNILPDPQGQAYSYVIPDGMMQPVVLQIAKVEDKMEELIQFDLNPFLGVFERGESVFKPA
jgi:type II secretory pathway pseudopilin PulG